MFLGGGFSRFFIFGYHSIAASISTIGKQMGGIWFWVNDVAHQTTIKMSTIQIMWRQYLVQIKHLVSMKYKQSNEYWTYKFQIYVQTKTRHKWRKEMQLLP